MPNAKTKTKKTKKVAIQNTDEAFHKNYIPDKTSRAVTTMDRYGPAVVTLNTKDSMLHYQGTVLHCFFAHKEDLIKPLRQRFYRKLGVSTAYRLADCGTAHGIL